MAYHPGLNSLYVPYSRQLPGHDGRRIPAKRQPATSAGGMPPTARARRIGGLAKIDMATGEMPPMYKGRTPGNGAVLATAGDLVFWGDLDRKFRAFDADSGKILWETTLGGTIQNSTITYAVNGRQYVAVLTGEGLMTGGLITQANLQPTRRYNALYSLRVALSEDEPVERTPQSAQRPLRGRK